MTRHIGSCSDLSGGFTLAEVLITLGIIGVVAALTIPSLTHVYKKKLVETRLRHIYSVINQVLQNVYVEQGDVNNWTYENINTFDNPYLNALLAQRKFAENVIMKNLANAKLCTKPDKRMCSVYDFPGYNSSMVNKIILPDGGSGFWIEFPSMEYLTDGGLKNNKAIVGKISVDLNINKTEMKRGVDYFEFLLLRDKNGIPIVSAAHPNAENWGSDWIAYMPKCNAKFSDKDGNKIDSVVVCKDKNADNHMGYSDTHCAALIQCNGWSIPDNYPINF